MKDARLNKQATLQIVADHAGVSKATASMILSGRSKYVDLFTPDTIRKVQRSAAALGYRTNIFASNLEPSRTPFFALIIAGSQPDEWAYDAFESLFVAGVLAVSADAGAHPIVLTVSKEAPHAHVKSAEDIVFGGVFGTIARTPPASIEARLQEQLQREQPVVAVFPENASRWSSNMIEADNAAMGAVAGDLFACNGRKKWALICFKATAASQEVRRESLAEAARRHGAKLEVVRLDANPLFARDRRATRTNTY